MQKKHFFLFLIFNLFLFPFLTSCMKAQDSKPSSEPPARIKLPEPRLDSGFSLEKAIQKRRSKRNFKDDAVNLSDLSQILWAAQGITDTRGYRTVPSAGALFPLELYIAAGNVKDLPAGIYKYDYYKRELIKVAEGDKRYELSVAALDQVFVEKAPFTIIIAAVYERVTKKYGQRGIRYVDMEAGHAGQNISLQAVALNLGTCPVGAFDDGKVKSLLKLEESEVPLYIFPVGKPR